MFPYFAYGSNLNPDQIKDRCPSVTFGEKAILNHYLLSFVSFSHNWGGGLATVIPYFDKKVDGFLYYLNSEDIIKLDSFESGYCKIQLSLKTSSGDKNAFTYAYQGNLYQSKPSERYLTTIKNGYLFHGLDASSLIY